MMNQLLGKGIDYFRNQMATANNEIGINLKRILGLYNQVNLELTSKDRCYVCAYCLVAFSGEEVNQSCSHNKSYKVQPKYEVAVPDGVRGNKMHFWVEARKD